MESTTLTHVYASKRTFAQDKKHIWNQLDEIETFPSLSVNDGTVRQLGASTPYTYDSIEEAAVLKLFTKPRKVQSFSLFDLFEFDFCHSYRRFQLIFFSFYFFFHQLHGVHRICKFLCLEFVLIEWYCKGQNQYSFLFCKQLCFI